jgi:uncharacterized membrane protein
VYCTVIPFLLLILLSHSSCALSFFFGIQFIRQREREKEKKSKKKREKKERDEQSVEQFCLHQ